jgi:hypothetical protein
MNTRSALLVMLLFPVDVFAQRVVDVDKFDGSALSFLRTVGGEPLANTKFVRVVEGSPYFSEQWMKGNVLIEESEYRNLYLRLNVFETALEFLDTRGDAMVCTQPIKKVLLNDSIKGVQYHFIHSSFLPQSPDIKRAWLMQLADGPAGLYKLEKKTINEIRPYGSATTEQHIVDSYTYFVLYNNSMYKIKKTTDIPDILNNKKTAIADFIKTNDLSSKAEKDIIRVINYYNTL